jgi:hypothetical protein
MGLKISGECHAPGVKIRTGLAIVRTVVIKLFYKPMGTRDKSTCEYENRGFLVLQTCCLYMLLAESADKQLLEEDLVPTFSSGIHPTKHRHA